MPPPEFGLGRPISTTGATDLDPRLEVMTIGDLERVAKELGVDVQSLRERPGGDAGPGEPLSYGEEEGQSFWNRLQAGFKSTPKEKFEFYKSTLGPENVSASQEGDILWRHPEKGWQKVDESGFSWGDIADFGGDLPEMAGMILASRIPGGPLLRGAAGAAGGNIVKQGIEQVLPGESEVSGGELAASAVGGGVSEKAGGALASLIAKGPTAAIRDKLTNWLTKNIDTGEGFGSPFAKKSVELSGKFDIPLTASQITQGPFEKTLAGYAARSPFGIAAFEKHETLTQRKSAEAAERLLDRFGPRIGEADLGKTVRTTLDTTVSGLENTLFRQAEKDFAFLDRALGGRPVIPAQHLQVFLEKQAERYMAPDMPAEARKVGERLMREATGIPQGMLSARAMKERLTRLANASYGKEPLFESIDFTMDKAGQMRLAKDAYQALLRDLDEAATAGSTAMQQQQGPVARLLQQARNNYQANMAPIDELRRSTLARFGYSPDTQGKGIENMAGWFRQKVRTPTEVRNALEILRGADPEMGDNLTRYLIEQAVEAGKRGGMGSAAGFDRKEFLKKLPRPEILEALHPGDPRKGTEIARDIRDLSELLARSLWQGGQRPVLQESPYKTAGSIVSQETMFGKGRALLERVLTPRAVAMFETDPTARETIYRAVERFRAGQPMTRALETRLERLLAQSIPVSIYEAGVLANESGQSLPNEVRQ